MTEGEPPQPTYRLRIDLSELEVAFDNAGVDIRYYLDLETGAVVIVTEDARYEYDQLRDEAGDVAASDWPAALEAAMQAEDLPDWERELMRTMDQLERYGDERYLPVPQASSNDGYGDMQAFIETVDDHRLGEQLWQAIEGRHPFRAFKDVLLDQPPVRERWFAFKQAQAQARILDWLESEGVALVTGADAPAPGPET